MRQAEKIAREEALTDALRAADEAIGQDQPHAQALRIIAAIKRLRDGQPARVPGTNRVDYLAKVQELARAAWIEKHDPYRSGAVFDASAGIDTPLGRLRLVTWRRPWKGDRHGERVAWAGEYYLNDEPITVAEIRAAGLAQRPTSRNRQKKETRP